MKLVIVFVILCSMAFCSNVEGVDVRGEIGQSGRAAIFTFDIQSENAELWRTFFQSLIMVLDQIKPTATATPLMEAESTTDQK